MGGFLIFLGGITLYIIGSFIEWLGRKFGKK